MAKLDKIASVVYNGSVSGANGSFSNGGATTTAANNHLTYRGYYYDYDLGMYYLQSRYYDQKVGRFINADSVSVIGATPTALTDKNLFAYCDNNPVMRVDEAGEFWHILIGAAVGAAVSGIISIAEQIDDGKDINWAVVGVSAAAGFLSGALATVGASPAVGMLIQVSGNMLISGAESIANQKIEKGKVESSEVLFDSLIGGLTNVGNGLSKGASKHLMTQGIMATKQISKKGLKKASKYYLSQTSKMFYKPLFSDAWGEILDSSIKARLGIPF